MVLLFNVSYEPDVGDFRVNEFIVDPSSIQYTRLAIKEYRGR